MDEIILPYCNSKRTSLNQSWVGNVFWQSCGLYGANMSKLVKIITNIWKQFQTSHKCYLLTIKNCLHLWRKNYSIWMIIFVIVIFLLWNICWYLSLNGMFLTSFQLLKFMSYEMSKKIFYIGFLNFLICIPLD